jgi:dynein heavy chain, axonemal
MQPAETADLMERLEETQVTLGSYATNRFASPFHMLVSDWTSRLAVVAETFEHWLNVQVRSPPNLGWLLL